MALQPFVSIVTLIMFNWVDLNLNLSPMRVDFSNSLRIYYSRRFFPVYICSLKLIFYNGLTCYGGCRYRSDGLGRISSTAFVASCFLTEFANGLDITFTETKFSYITMISLSEDEGENIETLLSVEYSIKSSVRLRFLFQKFISAKIVHHSDCNVTIDEFYSPSGSTCSNNEQAENALMPPPIHWSDPVSTSIPEDFLSPITKSNGDGYSFSAMRNNNLSSMESPDFLINPQSKSDVSISARSIRIVNPIVLSFRTPFIWHYHLCSLSNFDSSLVGKELWLRNEIKRCVTTALCRTILQKWCAYAAAINRAKLTGYHIALRRGLNRWLEFLFALKLGRNRKTNLSIHSSMFSTTRYRHFNVSSVKNLQALQESHCDRSLLGIGSRKHETSKSMFSFGESGMSKSGHINTLSTAVPASASKGDAGSADSLNVSRDASVASFRPLKFARGSALRHSQLSGPGDDTSHDTQGQTSALYGNASGVGTSWTIDRAGIRELWSRSGPFATLEGCAFQVLCFRRLYKRTVLYARSKRVMKLVKGNMARLCFTEWTRKYSGIKKYEMWLVEEKVPYIEKRLFKYRKCKAFRMLKEFRVWSQARNAREARTIAGVRNNVLCCKAVRFMHCPAYVKCFYSWKKYFKSESCSPKVFRKASESHEAMRCKLAIRQWRYYLGVTEHNLLGQQLRQINRLRLFGLRVTLLSLVDSINDREDNALESNMDVDDRATSRMSIAELEEVLNEHLGEGRGHDSLNNSSDPASSTNASVNNGSIRGLSTTSYAALKRQHPLLWKEYSSLYGSIKAMDEKHHQVYASNRGSSFASSSYSNRKRQLNAVRDYLVLLTNRIKYIRCLRKLKLYSITPRLYFSPSDVLRSELNPDTNSSDSRKICISIREKGSTRCSNATLIRQQKQQVSSYRRSNYTVKASTTNAANNPNNTYSRIFHELGGGVRAFQYTSCVMFHNHTSMKMGAGNDRRSGDVSMAPQSPVAHMLSSKAMVSSSKACKYSQYVSKKPKKLCIKSGNYVYSSVAAEDASPYLYSIYKCKQNHMDVSLSRSTSGRNGKLITGNPTGSQFVRDSTSGIISTRSSMYLVQFRRFLNKCRVNISVRRKANAVKAAMHRRFGSSIMNIWKFAYMEEKRYRMVLFRRGIEPFKLSVQRRRYAIKQHKKSKRYEIWKHWKLFRSTLVQWKAVRRTNKERMLIALINPVPAWKYTAVNVDNGINALTLFGQAPPDDSKTSPHAVVRRHVISIKKYFPMEKEHSELYRNLLKYMFISEYRAHVMRCWKRWRALAARRHKLKMIHKTLITGLKANSLHRLKRNSHLNICFRKIRCRRYHRSMFRWKILTVQKWKYLHILASSFKAWRSCYLHNLALRVWIRPILEKQQNAFSKWKSCVRDVLAIGDICIENYRLHRLHNVFTKWVNIRRAIALYRRNIRVHLLSQFHYYSYSVKKLPREYELFAVFHRFRKKMKRAVFRKRRGVDILRSMLLNSNSGNVRRIVVAKISKMNTSGEMHYSKKSFLKVKSQFEIITCRHKEQRALSRWKDWSRFGAKNRHLVYSSDLYFNQHLCSIGMQALREHVFFMRADRLQKKRDALNYFRTRTLSTSREFQLCLLSTDFYLRKHAKYCFKKWLLRTKKQLSTVRSMHTAKRYRANRMIGVALMLLRGLIYRE